MVNDYNHNTVIRKLILRVRSNNIQGIAILVYFTLIIFEILQYLLQYFEILQYLLQYLEILQYQSITILLQYKNIGTTPGLWTTHLNVSIRKKINNTRTIES